MRVGLGHRRLKIIDLKTGGQPMSNEDGTIWVVFNGEIYNFLTLRKNLEKKGHQFSTHSDTETIIHSYEDFGEGCLEQLNGAFSFAIWDQHENKLMLARDRLGIKPVYYCCLKDKFLFASELKSIIQHPEVKRTVNPAAIDQYLSYQYIPYPQTIYQGISKLPPGYYLTLKQGQLQLQQYWNVSFQKQVFKKESECINRLGELVEDAVEMRLISDVPFGSFLSGGIDSTVVTGIMSKLLPSPVKTFSMGFAASSFNELKYAQIASQTFSTQHYEFKVQPPDVVELLPRLIWHLDEPFADSSAIPTYMVSSLARKYVTMVLSGDGVDETFAGYHRYLAQKLMHIYNFIPANFREKVLNKFIDGLPETTRINDLARRLKRLTLHSTLPPAERYIHTLLIFDPALKEELYTSKFHQQLAKEDSINLFREEFLSCKASEVISKAQYLDTKYYLPEDILTKVDRMSMANSLEARVPMLDYRIVEFMASVPASLKIKGWWTKYLFKKTFKGSLPPSIYHRGKHGFGVPIGGWFKTNLKDFTSDILLEERTLQRGYFKKESVGKLLAEHQQGRYDHSHRIWALLMLELWHRFYLDNNLIYEDSLQVSDL